MPVAAPSTTVHRSVTRTTSLILVVNSCTPSRIIPTDRVVLSQHQTSEPHNPLQNRANHVLHERNPAPVRTMGAHLVGWRIHHRRWLPHY